VSIRSGPSECEESPGEAESKVDTITIPREEPRHSCHNGLGPRLVRSQTSLSSISTVEGDHAGISSVVCSFSTLFFVVGHVPDRYPEVTRGMESERCPAGLTTAQIDDTGISYHPHQQLYTAQSVRRQPCTVKTQL
jgi:hypothetical protein